MAKTKVNLHEVNDRDLISELKAYAIKHTAGNVTQAARELIAKGLAKGLSK